MVQFFVSSRTGVRAAVKKNAVTHVISITDGKLAYIHPSVPDSQVLRIKFEDVFDPHHPLSPRFQHMQRIADWVLRVPDNAVVLVHCEAGISRSTAVAWFCIVLKNKITPAAALNYVLRVRPEAVPNPLIAKLADDWFQKHMGFNFDQGFEELAKKHTNKLLLTKNSFAALASKYPGK